MVVSGCGGLGIGTKCANFTFGTLGGVDFKLDVATQTANPYSRYSQCGAVQAGEKISHSIEIYAIWTLGHTRQLQENKTKKSAVMAADWPSGQVPGDARLVKTESDPIH